MVGVDDHRRVLQIALAVQVAQLAQVLIVIVGQRPAILVHRAAQDGVGQRVALAVYLPLGEQEGVGVLGRQYGVHHHRQVAAGGVLHAHRHVQPAGDEPVLLILHRARADGYIGEDVGQIVIVLRIQQLIRAGKAGLLQHPYVHPPYGDKPLEHVRLGVGVRLVQHALIAVAGGPGLVAVDPGHDEYLLLHPLLQRTQAAHILQHRVLPVGGARPDQQHQPVVLPCDDRPDLAVVFLFLPGQRLRHRIHILDSLRCGQLAPELHIHTSLSFLLSLCAVSFPARRLTAGCPRSGPAPSVCQKRRASSCSRPPPRGWSPPAMRTAPPAP